MIYTLCFRDESRRSGGPVLPGRLELWGPDGVAAGPSVRDRLAVEPAVAFLLHGFNVGRDDGRRSLLRLARRLDHELPGALVATTWPGDHFTGPLSYSFEGRDADDTAHELARFAGDTLEPETPISFLCHSLGARVVLGAARRLREAGFGFAQLCLMAPAVDDDCLADPEVYRSVAQDATRLAVLHSTSDRVLRVAYPVGDLFQSLFFWRREDPGLALGYGGPAPAGDRPVPPNVIDAAIGRHGVGHGDYLPDGGEEPPGHEPKVDSATRYAAAVLRGEPEPRYRA